MRTRPLIGEKAWFGPKRFGGWGWTPVTWEGWLVIAVCLVAVFVTIPFASKSASATSTIIVSVVAGLALLAACALKGTSPGGPKSARGRRPD